MKLLTLIILSILISCSTQIKKDPLNKSKDTPKEKTTIEETSAQIGEYVTSVYEDSRDNLWFGTLNKGIARYDGNTLKYYSKKDGLASDRVIGIIEDDKGGYWLMTGAGLSAFDGTSFTNFTVKKDDFSSNMISQIMIDSKGIFWIGTWGGVYNFDGKSFSKFSIPRPKVDTPINEDTKNWITKIKEDPEGNIWFGRDGYGASKYDGTSFTHYLKKDGLHSNNVTEIEFDKDGNIWFGTRVTEKDNPDPTKRSGKGGVNRMNKNGIISFPEIGAFNNDDVYNIFNDHLDNIWISTIRAGVYKYKNNEFKQYNIPISIMDMCYDKNGNLWLSGAGGLYRINKNEEIINVTTSGPWH